MKHHQCVAAFVALALALTACSKSATSAPKETKDANSPAIVNGKPIDSNVFDKFVSSATRGQPQSQMTPEQKNQLLDHFIGMQLAAEAAEKAGLEKDKDLAGQIALNRNNLLAEAQFKKYLDQHPITDDEVKAEYDAQVGHMPREYHARHILVDDKAKADSIVSQLKKGGDFQKLAKEHSKDPSGKNGGDLGWFTLDTMVKPFSDAVAALEKGKYTPEPVQSQFGWHIILLEDSRARRPRISSRRKIKCARSFSARKWNLSWTIYARARRSRRKARKDKTTEHTDDTECINVGCRICHCGQRDES